MHHLVIVGCGIGGLTLAACMVQWQQKSNNQQWKITLIEKDEHWDSRSQGYSLTLQPNGRKVLEFLHLEKVIYNQSVPIVGHSIWNMVEEETCLSKSKSNKGNRALPRQLLRTILFDFLKSFKNVEICWNVSISSVTRQENQKLKIQGVQHEQDYFEKNQIDFLIGCDGIFSTMRSLLCTNSDAPHFLGVIAVNGIVSTNDSSIKGYSVQCLDGKNRMFIKPFDDNHIMWQLTIPHSETSTCLQELEKWKLIALQEISNWKWKLIVQLVQTTSLDMMRVGCLYDRNPMNWKEWKTNSLFPLQSMLLGDAFHAMSPFKGQGANNAMVDAMEFSQLLFNHFSSTNWEQQLTLFCNQMHQRSKKYVLASREAVTFYHSKQCLQKEALQQYRSHPR